MLSLIILWGAVASANLVDPAPALSCGDVSVRTSCALSYVPFELTNEPNKFLSSCVGLSVLVGEGLWPYKRWSAPKRLEMFVQQRWLWLFTSPQLRLEDDTKDYGTAEIYCPAESIDRRFLPQHREQLGAKPSLNVGDVLIDESRQFLVDAIYINRDGYVYATLRDQESGQSIARTLN